MILSKATINLVYVSLQLIQQGKVRAQGSVLPGQEVSTTCLVCRCWEYALRCLSSQEEVYYR